MPCPPQAFPEGSFNKPLEGGVGCVFTLQGIYPKLKCLLAVKSFVFGAATQML